MGILHFSLFLGVTYRSPLSLRYFFSICSLEFSLGSHRCFPVCSLKSYVDLVFPSILFLLLLLRSCLPLWISFQPLPEAPPPPPAGPFFRLRVSLESSLFPCGFQALLFPFGKFLQTSLFSNPSFSSQNTAGWWRSSLTQKPFDSTPRILS